MAEQPNCVDIYLPKKIPGLNISFDDFVPVRNYPEYEINGNGVVRNVVTKKIKKPICVDLPRNNQIYYHIDLWKNNVAHRRAVHRLLMLTFRAGPLDAKSYLVNHRDGDGRNNAIDNLEWCDHSDNITHAYATGLRKDNIPVLLKNIDSGDIVTLRSFHQAAHYLNIKPQALHDHYTKHRMFPINGHFIQKESDNLPWPTKVEKRIIYEKVPVSVCEKATGRTTFYQSVKQAYIHTSAPYSSVALHIRTKGIYENDQHIVRKVTSPTQ